MRKILLLGGSYQQIIAIETAKRLGLYTVLCDYLPDNPGQFFADKFYLVSTTDKEAVLYVAKKECVDGVLAYASDPAAPTAAYVAEKLGLPTNPYNSVDILCNKDKFRDFLCENGFSCPESYGFCDKKTALGKKNDFNYPIIVKPVDSSGSKGVTILHSSDNYDEAIDFAFSFSRIKRIIVEQYIECKHKYTIGGDIFINDGKVIIWGLMNCFRDHSPNPLVPGGEFYPSLLKDKDLKSVKNTLKNLVDKLQIKSGCINVEVMIDKEDQIYLIDIGPRAGGNMIPIQLSYVFGVDIVEMSILSAMGEELHVTPKIEIPYCATYVLHSETNGVYQDIVFSDEIEKHIFRKELYLKQGEAIEAFDNAAKALGIVFLRFSSMEEMIEKMNRMNEYVKVILK